MNILRNSLLLFVCFLLSLSALAQVNLQAIQLRGKVTCDGQGVANVRVTDGVNIVKTDADGTYALLTNATTDFVYISVPAGYKVPMKENIPYFFHPIDDKATLEQEFNFELTKLSTNEDKHNLVVWADPQVYYDEDLTYVQQSANDVKAHLQTLRPNVSSYGVVVGDIVGNANAEPLFYDPMQRIISTTGIPFFYTVGNHDILYYVRSDEPSKEIYKKTFGPNYYSFDRGEVHYIVLDDCFYNGNTWYYIGYLTERQLAWLEQDLATVPEGTTIMLSMHIPAYSQHARKAEWGKEKQSRVLQNRSYLFDMLKNYNVHILSGHMHEMDNFIIKPNIMEHNHPAICALFYEADWCSDGTPRGYTVYEIDGSDVKWHYKAVGESIDLQFKLYGIGESKDKPESVVANVWNYDPQWKVVWYENGEKMGEMEQFRGLDPNITEYVKQHRHNFKHTWANASLTDHLFFATPKSADSTIKVEVTDRFGNVYTQEIK